MPDPTSPPAPNGTASPRRAVAAVLLALLGFAIVVQVRQNSGSDNLANLREDDLINILDDQNLRADRLRQQITELQNTLRRLQDSGDRAAAARATGQADAEALGVLLGTVAAHGTGVSVTITDPHGRSTRRRCSTSSRNCAEPAPRRSSSAPSGCRRPRRSPTTTARSPSTAPTRHRRTPCSRSVTRRRSTRR